jgi:hypothetical protein
MHLRAPGFLRDPRGEGEVAMIRFRRTTPNSNRTAKPAAMPDFWGRSSEPYGRLSLVERAALAREHGGADIVTSFGLVLSLR